MDPRLKRLSILGAVALLLLTISARADDFPIGPCGGDTASAYPNCTVVGVRGNAVPALATGFLQWTGSAFAWSTPSGSFTAGNDLSGTSSSQNVVAITGSAGTVVLRSTANVLQWVAATTAPGLAQADLATNSGTGATLTVQAQNETGTTSNGGPLVLESGTGTTAAGAVTLKTGATTQLQITSALIAASEQTKISLTQSSFTIGTAQASLWMENPAGSQTETVYSFAGTPESAIRADSSGNFSVHTVGYSQFYSSLGITAPVLVLTSGGVTINQGGAIGEISTAALSFAIASTATINQNTLTTNSGTGGVLKLQAQNETGTASFGGELDLLSGTGTSANGAVVVKPGGTTAATISGTGTVTLANLAGTGTRYVTASSTGLLLPTSIPTWHTTTFCSSGCTQVSGTTYTPVTSLIIAGGCGGGGGGGGAAAGTSSQGAGGGGGGGGSQWKVVSLAVTPATAITVFDGPGGAGGTSGSGPAGPGATSSLVVSATPIMLWEGASGGTSLDSSLSTTDFQSQEFIALGGAPTTTQGISNNASAYSFVFATAPGSGGEGGGGLLFRSLAAVDAPSVRGLDADIAPSGGAAVGQGGNAGSIGTAGAGSPGEGGGGGGGGGRGSGANGGAGGAATSSSVGGAGTAGSIAAANTCAGGGGAGGGASGTVTPGAAAAGGAGGSGYVRIDEFF